jgi:hypothetical protein
MTQQYDFDTNMAAHLQRLLTKKLDVACIDAMQKMITTDEMKAALFAIQSNKAHGSNGFSWL